MRSAFCHHMDFFLTVLGWAVLFGSTIGLALGIPAALRLRKAIVIGRSIAAAVVGTFVGILLAFATFQKLGASLGSGLFLMWFVLPSIVSVMAIVLGELVIFLFERSQRRN